MNYKKIEKIVQKEMTCVTNKKQTNKRKKLIYYTEQSTRK